MNEANDSGVREAEMSVLYTLLSVNECTVVESVVHSLNLLSCLLVVEG